MPETAGRPHHSVKSKESIFVRAVEQGWKRAFDDPILLPSGRKLVTLLDAANYAAKLPKKDRGASLAKWATVV